MTPRDPVSGARPPALARVLAAACLRGDAHEVITGDLDEEFVAAIAGGVAPATARRQYWRQTLASIAAVRRHTRLTSQALAFEESHMSDDRSFRLLRGLSLDLRHVRRVLGKSPGYVAVAILSLAIGIGANTAIFSLVRHLLLEPMPVDRPAELSFAYWADPPGTPLPISQINSSGYRDTATGVNYRSNYTYAGYQALRASTGSSADVAGFAFVRQLTAEGDGQSPVAVSGMLVSANYFATLRPGFVLGRPLDNRDDVPGAPVTAVIGHALWMRMFGGDTSVIGRTLRFNGTPASIVGVTAAPFRGLSQGGFFPQTDVTLALAQQPLITPQWSVDGSLFASPTIYWVRLLVRSRPEAVAPTVDALGAALRTALTQSGIAASSAAAVTSRLLPGARGVDSLRRSTEQPLTILSAVVAVVLLIACVNVAGLMLARGVARQRELALRRALGASRFRLIRELLLESLLLSLAGGVAGLLVALWAGPVITTMLTAGLGTSGVGVSVDWTLLATTAALSCAAGVLSGLMPALRFSRDDPGRFLKDRASGSGAPRLTAGRVLLTLQIAISVPLVVGAGLFLRTLHNLASVDLGFDPKGLALFTVDPTMNGKMPERASVVYPRLLEALDAIPGVTSATLLENALISGWMSNTTVTVDGHTGPMYMNAIGPDYFETLGVPLIAGRAPGPQDRATTPRVVVINQTAVRKYFGDGSPIGRHFKSGGGRDVEVIGVAADSKYDGLRTDVQPTMFQPYLQRDMGAMHVLVRTSVSPASLRAAIVQAVDRVDRTMPVTEFKTQTEQIDETIGKERVFTRLLSLFGTFALLLACIGLHGVTSYSVARRTSEIGIRLALGAQRAQVLWLILRQVVVLAVVGLALGMPAAWAAGPAVRALLFGLEPSDPVTIAVAAAVMFAVAVGAGLLPARRAARMQALAALRTD